MITADPLRILIVDDSPEDRTLYRRLLAQFPSPGVQVVEAELGEEGLDVYQAEPLDCILLDYHLPDLEGLEFLDELARVSGEVPVPVLVLTGQGSETVAAETLKAGASDYLPKASLTFASLERAVRNAVEKARLRAAVEEKHNLLQQSHQAIEEQHRVLQQTHQALERGNAEIQQFYHMVSHELKTPLTSARSFTTILLDELTGPLTAEQREYVDFIQDSCDQMTHGLNDLIEVTRLHTGKLLIESQPCCIGTVVTHVVGSMTPMAQEKGIELSYELDPVLPEVIIDERRIMQVLMNLLTNAFKFTPSGGTVAVGAAFDTSQSTMMRVSVSDTGRGIPVEQQERIFDRLYQTQQHDTTIEGGLGLGLHICQELVKLHGGELEVESLPDAGSTFTFTVPIYSG